MEFANAAHRETQGRVEEYLGELFEDPYLDPETSHFYVRYGTTVLEIAVDPYGPEETMVQVMAYCVQGVRLEPDLMLGLLELNHHLAFGAFSLVGRDIFLSHTLFGRGLDRGALLGAIAAVANVSDEYDDRIVAKYGGQTALDRIRDTGGKPKAKDAVVPLASNRKARHDYEVLETVEAGVQLAGTEVKAARQGRVQLKDSYVEFRDGQAFLVGVHIGAYSHGNRENHEPERPRKLLLHRREIDRLFGQVQQKGLTVVPLELYLKGAWVKAELALVRGKKLYDKRETEKRKTLDREMRQAISDHG